MNDAKWHTRFHLGNSSAKWTRILMSANPGFPCSPLAADETDERLLIYLVKTH